MSVSAVSLRVDAIRARGAITSTEAAELTSKQVAGRFVNEAEHALLKDLKDRVDRSEIKADQGARDVLAHAVVDGPDGIGARVKAGLLSSMAWGGGVGAVSVASTFIAFNAGGGHGMEGLAMGVGTMLAGAAATAGSALVAGLRAALRD